jgi:hypothetical protein
MTLSPILASELFQEASLVNTGRIGTGGTAASGASAYSAGAGAGVGMGMGMGAVNEHAYFRGEDLPRDPMTNNMSRPSTADLALREYLANREAQQEVFDMENLSLHSSDDATYSESVKNVLKGSPPMKFK